MLRLLTTYEGDEVKLKETPSKVIQVIGRRFKSGKRFVADGIAYGLGDVGMKPFYLKTLYSDDSYNSFCPSVQSLGFHEALETPYSCEYVFSGKGIYHLPVVELYKPRSEEIARLIEILRWWDKHKIIVVDRYVDYLPRFNDSDGVEILPPAIRDAKGRPLQVPVDVVVAVINSETYEEDYKILKPLIDFYKERGKEVYSVINKADPNKIKRVIKGLEIHEEFEDFKKIKKEIKLPILEVIPYVKEADGEDMGDVFTKYVEPDCERIGSKLLCLKPP